MHRTLAIAVTFIVFTTGCIAGSSDDACSDAVEQPGWTESGLYDALLKAYLGSGVVVEHRDAQGSDLAASEVLRANYDAVAVERVTWRPGGLLGDAVWELSANAVGDPVVRVLLDDDAAGGPVWALTDHFLAAVTPDQDSAQAWSDVLRGNQTSADGWSTAYVAVDAAPAAVTDELVETLAWSERETTHRVRGVTLEWAEWRVDLALPSITVTKTAWPQTIEVDAADRVALHANHGFIAGTDGLQAWASAALDDLGVGPASFQDWHDPGRCG